MVRGAVSVIPASVHTDDVKGRPEVHQIDRPSMMHTDDASAGEKCVLTWRAGAEEVMMQSSGEVCMMTRSAGEQCILMVRRAVSVIPAGVHTDDVKGLPEVHQIESPSTMHTDDASAGEKAH